MAARKKARKKITLKEFKAWLEGADDFHGKDWAPTPEQWKMIREKIDNIEEPKPEIREVVKEVQAAPQMADVRRQPPAPAKAPVEVPALPPNIPPPPPVPGSVPPGPVVEGSTLQDAPPTTIPSPMPRPSSEAEGGRSTTPNIDTSDGKYQSGFV